MKLVKYLRICQQMGGGKKKQLSQKRSTGSEVAKQEGEPPQNEDPLDFNFIMPDFDELLELYKRKSIFGDELLPYGVEQRSSKSKKKLTLTTPIEDVDLMQDANIMKQNRAIAADAANPQDKEVHILPICNTPDPLFSYLAVRAVVIDPYCELSAQRIVLPPTPYYSYTITPFYLRCPNMQSYKICHCGPEINKHHKPPLVRARFEFFSNLKFLDVEPSSGQILTGQNIKINVIVRPRLTTTEILERAKILKAIAEKERLLRERERRKRGKKSAASSRRGSRRQSSRKGSRRSSRRASRRASQKSGGQRKSMKRQSTAKGAQRKSMKRQSTAKGGKRQSTVAKKRQSAAGKRQSAAGKRQSAAGKRKSAVGRKSTTGKGGKEKRSKGSSAAGSVLEADIVVNPQDMVPDETDLFNAKLDLMRYQEPTNFATKVVCHIEAELENHPYTKRKEELELYLYGTLVRPDIVVFTPPHLEQHIKFETTAVGMKRTLFFDVYNTSGRSVLLNHSFFDAPETYNIPVRLPLDQLRPNHFLKTGMWLEPDHHVKWPVIFSPKKEKTISEFIEIRGNKTVVPIKIQGRGVEPKFKITPEFILGKLRSYIGVPAKLSFLIQNQCDAELEFDFLKQYTKEGPIYPLDLPKRASSKKSSSRGRKSVTGRKSVSRKSVASRKSVSRKSVASRKSVSSRKSVAGGRKSLSGKKKSREEDMAVQKGDIKDEGRKNIADHSKKGSSASFPAKNYEEVLKGDLISSLKKNFVPVDGEKQENMFTIPSKTIIKPHTARRFEVIFRPFKAKNPEDAEEKDVEDKKSRKSMSRKSLSRKSVSRKSSVKRKSKAPARKSVAKGGRKSMARKSVARKSVARKSVAKGARKSVAKGGRKSVASGRKSQLGHSGQAGRGTRKGSKKVEYIIEEESFKKTFAGKVRLMLGPFTKVLDWWFLGQVFRNKESVAFKEGKAEKKGKKK